MQRLYNNNEKKLTLSFHFMFRYIDGVFSLNNSKFDDFVHHIYSIELEIKDTTDTDRSASYFDLHRETDSYGRPRTKLYDERDDLYTTIFKQHLYMEYISLSWSDIPDLVVPIRISLIVGSC